MKTRTYETRMKNGLIPLQFLNYWEFDTHFLRRQFKVFLSYNIETIFSQRMQLILL